MGQPVSSTEAIPLLGSGKGDNFTRGQKIFELTNHLGNVLAVVSDRKTGVDGNADGRTDHYIPDITSAQDYYAFGMIMPGRKFSSGSGYRYGFNGKEEDDEVKGDGNQQDYGMRIYDPRLGRFLSVDPLTKKYPWNSVYAFAENDVISCIDLDGLEKINVHVRSFIRAKTTEDPIGRVFKGDDRDANTLENATARGRAQFSYDFKTNKVEFKEPYADETLRYDDDGVKTRVGKVDYRPFKKIIANGMGIGIHYETKNPLTPPAFTPTVDVDAGYAISFNKKSNTWTIGFYGKSDGYPSTETFVEDESGQRIMLGYRYDEGSPGKKLWGQADTEVFKGVIEITLDDKNNFMKAYLISENKKIELLIEKPEVK